MILTENGVLKLMQRIKSFITSQLNTKAASVHTHTLSEIDDLSNLSMGGGVYSKSEVDTLLNDYIPKVGGGGLTGGTFYRNVDNKYLVFGGATGNLVGGTISLYGPNYSPNNGQVQIIASLWGNNYKVLELCPNGSWSWSGQPIQYGSDQRLKQQIAEIDNKLLDAWEDVTLCQFKYNDAVDEKGNAARLHTGYVVQQIDEACKSHNLDISEYGLYCHEEYPQETEEVEVKQDDGTKTKEKKVIREASEHYSLRYTEALVVECAYLRRENNRLKERLSKIEKLLNI